MRQDSLTDSCAGDPVTTTLYRTIADLRADESGRTVFGRVVPYGETIEVYSGFFERFEPGAFTRSIAERGHKVKLLTGHDHSRLPVGKATEFDERADGLHASFLVASTRDGDEALNLVRGGFVDSFSVGFRPVRDLQEKDVTVRLEAALMEVSLVFAGAYDGAQVAGVRSAGSNRLSVDLARRRLDLILKAW